MSVTTGKQQDMTLLLLMGAAYFMMVLLAPILTFGSVQAAASSQFTGEGSSVRQIGYVFILLLVVYASFRTGRGWTVLLMPWPVLLALAWCWGSIWWAVAPDIAVRRLALTTIVMWTAFIFVQGAGYEKSIATLRVMMVIALLGNYATVVLDPSVGVHQMLDGNIQTAIIGNWRGFMTHKNFAGAASAICILLFLFDTKNVNYTIKMGVIFLAAFFLFKSQSKTSAGMLGISIIVGWIYQKYDKKIRLFFIPLLTISVAAILVLDSAYQDILVRNYFKASSFTGRGLIWKAMIRYAEDNALYGAGFGSFWNIGTDSPIYHYGQGFVREVTVGHNGYLDLLVTVGIPGLVLVFFAMVLWPLWRLLVRPVSPSRGALTAALLLFGIGHNITETSMFERDALIGVIMIIAVAFANNWQSLNFLRPKASGNDVFAALRKRSPGTT